MYPILPFLERRCCSNYELPAPTGTGTIKLPVGTGVYVPVLGIHFDPTYFPEPEKFDPDRFTEENKSSRPNFAYLAFGEGPRMCLGKDRNTYNPIRILGYNISKLSLSFLCNEIFHLGIGTYNLPI
jgi:hypothetical protein